MSAESKENVPPRSQLFLTLFFAPRVLSARMRVNFPHSPRAYLRKENKHAGGLIGAVVAKRSIGLAHPGMDATNRAHKTDHYLR